MATSSFSHDATDVLNSQLDSIPPSPIASTSIGIPQCTSTPLPKRSRPPALVLTHVTLPDPPTSSLLPYPAPPCHPGTSPLLPYPAPNCHPGMSPFLPYPASPCPQGTYSFFRPSPATCYTPSYSCCLPPNAVSTGQHRFNPVLHGQVTVASGQSSLFQTSPCFSPPSVVASPISESRPADFLHLPGLPKFCPPVPKSVAKPSTSVRQASLEEQILALRPSFPAETKEVQRYLAFHTSSIRKEQHQCLSDGFFPADYNDWLARRYSEQLHLVLDAVARSVQLLERRDQKSCPATRALNPEAIALMEHWFLDHLNNPYPTQAEVEDMADQGEITVHQLRKWFANKRHRNRKPRSLKAVAKVKEYDEFVSSVIIA